MNEDIHEYGASSKEIAQEMLAGNSDRAVYMYFAAQLKGRF